MPRVQHFLTLTLTFPRTDSAPEGIIDHLPRRNFRIFTSKIRLQLQTIIAHVRWFFGAKRSSDLKKRPLKAARLNRRFWKHVVISPTEKKKVQLHFLLQENVTVTSCHHVQVVNTTKLILLSQCPDSSRLLVRHWRYYGSSSLPMWWNNNIQINDRLMTSSVNQNDLTLTRMKNFYDMRWKILLGLNEEKHQQNFGIRKVNKILTYFVSLPWSSVLLLLLLLVNFFLYGSQKMSLFM